MWVGKVLSAQFRVRGLILEALLKPDSMLSRPSVVEVEDFLRNHSAILVHFSGAPKGIGYAIPFPSDLQSVIEGNAQGGLSASLVTPRDEFDDPVTANATGCVGVILGLRTPSSLVAVSAGDCGSETSDGVRTVGVEVDISLPDLERSLSDRGVADGHHYNEWVVRDFDVRGIFATEPHRVMRLIERPGDVPEHLMSSAELWAPESIGLEEIRSHFPGQKIFTFADGVLIEA